MGIFDNLRDTLKLVKGSSHRGILVCPKCGSTLIRPSMTGGGKGWIIPSGYECDACGYGGLVVLELEKEEDTAPP